MIDTLINSTSSHLVQSTLFAGAAALLTLAFRANRAQVRFWLWLSASLKFLIPFALLSMVGSHIDTWAPPSSVEGIRAAAPAFLAAESSHFSGDTLGGVGSSAGAPSIDRTALDKVIAGVWLCGVVCVALIRLRGWRRIRLLIRESVFTDIAAPVETRASPGLMEPGVVGWRRPLLLLPQGIAERLSPSEMNAILAHELCHVRRRDNLLALIHMIVEAIFWFHPLVWWVGARLIEERECACDEDVVSRGNAPDLYAEAILKVCKWSTESPMACVAGVTGGDLKRRIEQIMNARDIRGLSFAKKAALTIAGAAVLMAPVLVGIANAPAILAQSLGGRPKFDEFEVATIKPTPPGAGGRWIRMRSTHEFAAKNHALKTLIAAAYNLNPRAISGGPEWLDSDRYDIVAKAPNEVRPNLDEQMSMLRKLLADRFQLSFHREQKELRVYTLTVAKGGPKLKEGTVSPDASPEGPPPLIFVVSPQLVRLPGRNATMADFASVMQRAALDYPVLDKTGLSARYDFDLEFTPDETVFGGTLGNGTDDATRPNLFAAISQQLGLKLEATRGLVEALVIDRVARPPEN